MTDQERGQAQQQAAQNQPAVDGILLRIKAVASGVLAERKPWSELADRTAFSRPANVAEAMSRCKKNVAYFRINYFLFVLLTTVVCMVLNPSSLIVLGSLSAIWFYLFVARQAAITIGGRPFSPREQLIGMAVVSVVVVFFLTSVGTVLFTAIGFSLAGIGIHAALRVPDDLFLDDGETAAANTSVLSFLMQPAPPVTTGPGAV